MFMYDDITQNRWTTVLHTPRNMMTAPQLTALTLWRRSAVSWCPLRAQRPLQLIRPRRASAFPTILSLSRARSSSLTSHIVFGQTNRPELSAIKRATMSRAARSFLTTTSSPGRSGAETASLPSSLAEDTGGFTRHPSQPSPKRSFRNDQLRNQNDVLCKSWHHVFA